jgi:hypothetical protein
MVDWFVFFIIKIVYMEVNLYSNIKYKEEIKSKDILYLSWTFIMIFMLSVIVIHSTIHNSLVVSTLSILCLGVFIYYNYINLKI